MDFKRKKKYLVSLLSRCYSRLTVSTRQVRRPRSTARLRAHRPPIGLLEVYRKQYTSSKPAQNVFYEILLRAIGIILLSDVIIVDGSSWHSFANRTCVNAHGDFCRVFLRTLFKYPFYGFGNILYITVDLPLLYSTTVRRRYQLEFLSVVH